MSSLRKRVLSGVIALSLTWVGFALITGSPASGEGGLFSRFGFGKNKGGSRVAKVGVEVGAELLAIDGSRWSPPVEGERPSPAVSSGLTCQTVSVVDAPDGRRVEEAPGSRTVATAFAVGSTDSGSALLIENRDGGVELWTLGEDGRVVEGSLEPARISDRQADWVDYSIAQIACLTQTRLAVAVAYYERGPAYAIYVLDMPTRGFEKLAAAEPEVRNPDRFFEALPARPAVSLLLHYSDRQRESAEIYNNHIHHVTLFSNRFPSGIPVLEIPIDQGNIEAWYMDGDVLHLKTADRRDQGKPNERFWALNLSGVM